MTMTARPPLLACLAFLAAAATAHAAEPSAVMYKVTPEGTGDLAGLITIAMSPAGGVFRVNVKNLPPGAHGFHVHENGECGPATENGKPVPAGAAGGHWDPGRTGKHEGPSGGGHMGDLPVLEIAKDGIAVTNLTAPHIKDVEALRGHALVIHAGGDTFSDKPAPLGGGGARIVCGVIK